MDKIEVLYDKDFTLDESKLEIHPRNLSEVNEDSLNINYHGLMGAFTSSKYEKSINGLMNKINDIEKTGFNRGYVSGTTENWGSYGFFFEDGSLVSNLLIINGEKQGLFKEGRTNCTKHRSTVEINYLIDSEDLALFYMKLPDFNLINSFNSVPVPKIYSKDELTDKEQRLELSLEAVNEDRDECLKLEDIIVSKRGSTEEELMSSERLSYMNVRSSLSFKIKKPSVARDLLNTYSNLTSSFKNKNLEPVLKEDFERSKKKRKELMGEMKKQILEAVTDYCEEKWFNEVSKFK